MHYIVGAEFYREFNRLRHKVDSLSGPGTHNTPTSISHVPIPEVYQGPSPIQLVELKITGMSDGATSGRYTANIFYGGSNNSPDADLTEDDLGNLGTKDVEVWNLGEVENGTGSLQSGDYVWGILKGYNKDLGQPIYHVWAGQSDGGFCTVSQVGGDYGDAMTLPSWVYDIFDPDTSHKLASSLSPRMQRPVMRMLPGTIGTYRFDTAGNYVLWWVDEVPDTTGCGSAG